MLWASAQTYEALEAEMAQQAVEELVNQTKSGRQVLVGHSCDPVHNHDPEISRENDLGCPGGSRGHGPAYA